MKGFCIGYSGTEQIMQKEVEEITGAKSSAEDSAVVFELTDKKDLCKLCYLGQSFTRVLEFIDSFQLNQLSDFRRKIDFSIFEGKRIKVDCERLGEHDFKSIDIETELGDWIHENVKCTTDFKNPELIIFVYVLKDKCYIGIDYSGFDLSKRDYKVFLHPEAMKGPVAYFLLRYAEYESKHILLDPLCGSGIIPIEAGFFASGISINHFRKEKFQFIKTGIADVAFLEKIDKNREIKGKIYGFDKELRHITAAKQNAKIGGVDDLLNFGRVDVEWLDAKIGEETVDLIVTDVPHITKQSEKKIRKIYRDFFFTANIVLKKKGKIVMIGNDEAKKAAEEKGFKLTAEHALTKKELVLKIQTFEKAKV
jgi:putative N6-adenine-specific DNA methylase